ncbi:MAG: 30S ribosomal protein S18 [Elusimicrobia bacterium]|nr:30S ribosomal protein S18 [Elusimicrobiota bacterium]
MDTENTSQPGSSSGAPAPRPAARPDIHRRPDDSRRPYGPRKHFAPRRKVCRLCAEKIDQVDYKQVQIVKSFCTDTGKMLSRRITGVCAKHQRQVARAVKINRNLSIMPYSV